MGTVEAPIPVAFPFIYTFPFHVGITLLLRKEETEDSWRSATSHFLIID